MPLHLNCVQRTGNYNKYITQFCGVDILHAHESERARCLPHNIYFYLFDSSKQVLPTIGRINLAYTPPEYRRKGYATACVTALSQKLLD